MNDGMNTNPNWEAENAAFKARQHRVASLAWVACVNISPAHPEKVAEEIEEAFRLLAEYAKLSQFLLKGGIFDKTQALLSRLNLTEGE